MPPRTMYEKIWDAHAILEMDDGTWLLHIDRHLVNEVTSPQAFEGLRMQDRTVAHPELTIAVADHNVPTDNRDGPIEDPASRLQVETLERNVEQFKVPYIPLRSARQGIVHVVGPELGLTQPGMTIVCGDSHTSTHGAFGALAFGIGTSEVEHVLATQTLRQRPSKTMLVRIDNALCAGASAKDLALHVIGTLGTAGGTGYVIEYAGAAVEALDMAGRMTLCNLTIEAGARAGMIAPDRKTFDWLRGRPNVAQGEEFDAAVERWGALRSDASAKFDKTVIIDARDVAPMVTWGTSPDAVVPINGVVPDPEDFPEQQKPQLHAMLDYMGLAPGQAIEGLPIDVVFIGSCTNGRLEDLAAAAEIVRGKKVASGVRALIVPGSGQVRLQAEDLGLDLVFREAGFEWREAGCSMCLGMNPDRLAPGERCASTSNRNFEGRQGTGGRTHLVSPAVAAASALSGKIADPRKLER